MRRSEILIIRYRRISVVENSHTVRNEVVEADCVVVETQLSTESSQNPKLFAPPDKKKTLLVALISRLFKR